MPPVPGLLALMAMTFTPKMELRTDTHQSRYTGVLCGLGMDPENSSAVYQDHDVEIVFDTQIDDDDIFTVGACRNSPSC
jgi:ATP-dependent RNA helicase TDRD9